MEYIKYNAAQNVKTYETIFSIHGSRSYHTIIYVTFVKCAIDIHSHYVSAIIIIQLLKLVAGGKHICIRGYCTVIEACY